MLVHGKRSHSQSSPFIDCECGVSEGLVGESSSKRQRMTLPNSSASVCKMPSCLEMQQNNNYFSLDLNSCRQFDQMETEDSSDRQSHQVCQNMRQGATVLSQDSNRSPQSQPCPRCLSGEPGHIGHIPV